MRLETGNSKLEKRLILTGTVLGLLAGVALAADGDASGLLEKTGIKGGLCLVVGAKDLTLPTSLVEKSALYVQVLQPDAKLAMEWGGAVAGSANRERIGIRDAAFDPEHYGSGLFNLVVVEDVGAIGKAKLPDLNRILVPGGCVALKNAPGAAAEAKGLNMSAESIGAHTACRRPVTPVEWKPCDSLKWRAGMRAHMAVGICGPTHGGGRFFYREWLEAEGWPNSTTHLVARDACNGRVLWIKPEDTPWSTWRASQFVEGNWSLGADEAGRLFAVTKDGKLVCLDGATGEQRFELMASGAKPGYVTTHLDKYVLFGNSVFSAVDGKPLWKWTGKYMTLHDEELLESDGATLRIRKLADGAEVLKADLSWRGERVKNKSLGILHLGSHIIITEGGRWERPFVATALNPATGGKLWSYEFGGLFGQPPRGEKGKTFAGSVSYVRNGDKLLAYCLTPYFYDRDPSQKEITFTSIDLATGKADQVDFGPKARLHGSACATEQAVSIGDYLFYHHNVWFNFKTQERRFPYLVHPGCFLRPSAAYGMMYNSPGRKGGSIQGITAIGPADMTFDQEPGGKVLRRHASRPAFSEPTASGDWPTFRGGNARGNSTATELGTKLVKAWEVQVGFGGQAYGRMYAERTGLTQATVAYGMAYVADIGAQRVVALDVKDGKQKWAHHVGSRVDFPPTLYKGLCLFASKDGYVHCLDARTGAPVYKLLIAPRERYIGGQEKLESLWPTAADVMVDKDGVGHASAGFASTIHGGNRVVAFKVETGEVVESKVNFEPFTEAGYPGPKNGTGLLTEPLAGGFMLRSGPIDDMLAFGNSISRTNEDRANEVFGDGPEGKPGARARGRAIAFDEKLCVAYFIPYGGQAWACPNPMFLLASDSKPEKPLWKSAPIDLTVDDILLTPKYVYAVGHYRRVDGKPEIWTVSREDGKVLGKTPVDGFPSFLGLSSADHRLFVATRDGKLLCYRKE